MLALGQQIMLANNHPLLHSCSALLAHLNRPNWVFKTAHCCLLQMSLATLSMLYPIIYSAQPAPSENAPRCLVPSLIIPLLKNCRLFYAERWGGVFAGRRETLSCAPFPEGDLDLKLLN